MFNRQAKTIIHGYRIRTCVWDFVGESWFIMWDYELRHCHNSKGCLGRVVVHRGFTIIKNWRRKFRGSTTYHKLRWPVILMPTIFGIKSKFLVYLAQSFVKIGRWLQSILWMILLVGKSLWWFGNGWTRLSTT